MIDDWPTEHHPAADLVPPMADAEFEGLVDDIRERGLVEPIVTHEGRILDGRHRLQACRQAGVEPRFVEWDGAGGSPLGYVIASNVHRRHLTAGQRAVLAVELLPALEEEARERMAAGGRGDKVDTPSAGRSRAKAAQALGISEGYVAQAKQVAAESHELLKAVQNGDLSLPEAIKESKRRESERRRLDEVELGGGSGPAEIDGPSAPVKAADWSPIIGRAFRSSGWTGRSWR